MNAQKADIELSNIGGDYLHDGDVNKQTSNIQEDLNGRKLWKMRYLRWKTQKLTTLI